MNILGVISARGKSKGLKNKNIKPLLGKPVIYYTIEAAKEAKLLNKIVCSTENTRIASIAKQWGIEVIKRPEKLALDKARLDDVLRHAVKILEKKQNFIADAVVLLIASVPVRQKGIIDKAITEFLKTGADAVITVEDIGQYHPNWLLKLDKSHKIAPYSPTSAHRRQDLPKYYLHDGAVLVAKKDALMKNNGPNPLYPSLGRDIRAIIQSPQEVVDIDNEYDFLLAEAVLKVRKRK